MLLKIKLIQKYTHKGPNYAFTMAMYRLGPCYRSLPLALPLSRPPDKLESLLTAAIKHVNQQRSTKNNIYCDWVSSVAWLNQIRESLFARALFIQRVLAVAYLSPVPFQPLLFLFFPFALCHVIVSPFFSFLFFSTFKACEGFIAYGETVSHLC